MKNHAEQFSPARSQHETSSTDRVAAWIMATPPLRKPKEVTKKRERIPLVDEITYPSIARPIGAKGTHSYGQALYLLGLTLVHGTVKVPEVDRPESTDFIFNLDPRLIAEE